MRKSTHFFIFFTLLMLLSGISLFESWRKNLVDSEQRRRSIFWVKKINLTDPAIFTEASYIRHLSQADRHMAFQEHPIALERFPSGTLIQPPDHLNQ